MKEKKLHIVIKYEDRDKYIDTKYTIYKLLDKALDKEDIGYWSCTVEGE